MTISKGQTYREVGAQSRGSVGVQTARLPEVYPSAFCFESSPRLSTHKLKKI
jgi:hypothetical protein